MDIMTLPLGIRRGIVPRARWAGAAADEGRSVGDEVFQLGYRQDQHQRFLLGDLQPFSVAALTDLR